MGRIVEVGSGRAGTASISSHSPPKSLVRATTGFPRSSILSSTSRRVVIEVPCLAKARSTATLRRSAAINIIPDQAEWDLTFSEEYQTPLFFDEATAEELAPEVRPMLEDLLP